MSFPALRRSFSPKFILSFLRFIFNTLNLQSRAENFSTFNEKSRRSHIAAVRFTIGEGYLSDYFICPASRGKSGKTLCKVFPVPFSVCEAPKAPRRGDPRRGSPREKTVHRTVFSPRPALRFALSGACLLGTLRGNSAIAIAARGLCPRDPRGLLKKAGETFFCFRTVRGIKRSRT